MTRQTTVLALLVVLLLLAVSSFTHGDAHLQQRDHYDDVLSMNSDGLDWTQEQTHIGESTVLSALDDLVLHDEDSGVDVLNFDEVNDDDIDDTALINMLRNLYTSQRSSQQEIVSEPQSDATSLRHSRKSIRISAFNIQVFGVKKMSKPLVVRALVTILRQYDIILIQEIRDISDTAIWELLKLVNDPAYKSFGGSTINTKKAKYEIAISDRLGRTSSKEQYGYMYNTKVATLLETHQYKDTDDLFERPPYSAIFRVRAPGSSSSTTYFFTGVHISPQDAVHEIDSLVDVYESMLKDKTLSSTARASLRDKWIVMGDFNADCRYVPKSKFKNIRLWTQSRFSWLVKDVITTVSSECTYDRIVVSEELIKGNHVVVKSANAFNFRDAYVPEYLKNEDDVEDVSDHFPVHVQLRS